MTRPEQLNGLQAKQRLSETLKKRKNSGKTGRCPAHDAKIRDKALKMPLSSRTVYMRAAGGTASPIAAIKAFCCECVHYDRHEVTLCTSVACPLYMYRPYQKKEA